MFCGFGKGEIVFGVYLLANLYGLGISQVALGVKNMPANAGGVKDAGSIPGSGRSPGGGHDNPLQCSCLDRGAEGLQSMGSQRVGYAWSD